MSLFLPITPYDSLSSIITPYYSLLFRAGEVYSDFQLGTCYRVVRRVVRTGLCAGLCAGTGLHNLHKGCALFIS